MSRFIDQLPEPQTKCEKKVIVLSRSRVGTFSLYEAFQLLGYKPYHMYETVTQGPTHMRLFEEALKCKYKGAGKPYGKAEFDKWFADYDVIIEIPQFFAEELIECYPEAKFILTERSLDAWLKSVLNSLKMTADAFHSFPMNVVRSMDGFVESFASLTDEIVDVTFNGKGFEAGAEDAKRDTFEMQEKVKTLLPSEQLLVAKLEDGFGWEEICPFLGVDIPDTKYPRGNAPHQFTQLFNDAMMPRIRNAFIKIASVVVVPLVGIGGWYYLRRR